MFAEHRQYRLVAAKTFLTVWKDHSGHERIFLQESIHRGASNTQFDRSTVNVAIAAIIFAWLKLTAPVEPFKLVPITSGLFFERLLLVNLFMVAFNMIPALPMDGGRVLRAVLAMLTEHRRATQIAASIGQGIAVFFGVVGIFYNPFLLIIAFFVWIGASREARVAQMQSAGNT